MNQDGVSNDTATFSCLMFTYDLVCAHKKVSEIADQIALLGLVAHQDCNLTNAETCIGFGRMCNIIVCALVSDSMLCQHIFDVNSWYSCLLLLFHTLFPGIPFKMLNYQQIETPFSGSITGENIIQTLNFIII